MKLSRSYCPRLEILEDRLTPTTFASPIGASPVLLVISDTGPAHMETPTCGPPPFLHECATPGARSLVVTYDGRPGVYDNAINAFVAAGVSLEQLTPVPPGLVIAAAPGGRVPT
jgi:hypothetical protein